MNEGQIEGFKNMFIKHKKNWKKKKTHLKRSFGNIVQF